jgi:hypothetical protein
MTRFSSFYSKFNLLIKIQILLSYSGLVAVLQWYFLLLKKFWITRINRVMTDGVITGCPGGFTRSRSSFTLRKQAVFARLRPGNPVFWEQLKSPHIPEPPKKDDIITNSEIVGKLLIDVLLDRPKHHHL